VFAVADTTSAVAPDVTIERCATCRAACPVRTDTRAYVDLIMRGQYEAAFEKIREFNPFPSVCGLICHHPCEQACRREEVDEPVALRNLKRFAVEQVLEYRLDRRRRAEITQAETVGIVGSGPAGLTAAQDLIKQGYAVTVYEAADRAGGMLACAIPRYRLPEDDLALDIDDILALGIELKTGVHVGTDISLDELRSRHNAVILALGLSLSRGLPLENASHKDVVPALPFLKAAAIGEPMPVPDDVIVVGGGNVAVDVARTAVRLGAQTVKMVCLENEEERPAWDWECLEALEEGITFVYRRGPVGAVVEEGHITGMVVREVERVFDEQGRFSPTYFDERRSTVPGRMIILAIGQQADLGAVAGTDVKADRPGRLSFDAPTMSTSVAGVFACGEVVTGPGAAIEAVASGHRAAAAALEFLQTGQVRPIEEEKVEELQDLPEQVVEKVKRMKRIAMPTISAEERKKSFEQFELGYKEPDALREARRCLSCAAGATVDKDKCEACLTCLRVCPFGVPAVEDVAVMTSDMCQSCGLCAVECPAVAISIKRFEVGDIAGRIARLMKGSAQPVTRLEIACNQDAQAREDVIERVYALNGDVVGRIPVTCAALADEVAMMKPFELGARGVVVRRCSACRYRGADDRIEKRVARTRQILDAAGVGGDKLELV
jgi:formate dehydrogenase beta subunit